MSVGQQQENPIIHYLNDSFLIFRAEHAKLLRRRRILSNTVASGVSASPQTPGPPYCVSHYAAHLIATHDMGQFVLLRAKTEISADENRDKFARKLEQLINDEREMHVAKRTAELRRHNVEPSARNLGEFDESKMRLAISETPSGGELASYEEQLIMNPQIQTIINNEHRALSDRMRMRVYHDLYGRGFYVSSGLKFGSDFLAYMGDPVRYHAQYAIRVVDCDDRGLVDLSGTSFSEINCLQRLAHTANKTPLLATVDDSPLRKVRFWTLARRAHLNSDSRRELDLELVEPRANVMAPTEQIKIRRAS